MRDGTYPPRNFATLGPSGLRPPFTGNYFKSLKTFDFLTCSTGQASDLIHRFTTWQNLMFLLNSRHSLLMTPLGFSLSRGYRVNLPSSFKIITSYAFTY